MSNNHPRGNSSPEPSHTVASKPSGYTCRGVVRQGEDGRPLLGQTSQTGQTNLMQASRHSNTHTAVAIKLPSTTPTAALRPSHSRLRHCKPTGYTVTPPSSFYKSYKSYTSHASVTPSQHAYRRSHQTGTKKAARLVPNRFLMRAISLPPVEPATPSVPSAEFLPCREKVFCR